MSTIYILGAGATRDDVPEAPLVCDFWEKALSPSHLDGDGSFFCRTENFWNALAEIGFTKDDLITNRVNIEEMFSFLDFESFLVRDSYDVFRPLGARSAFTDLLARTLLPLASRYSTNIRHAVLARALKKGDTLLSFNYDLLLDRALLEARWNGDWEALSGSYGINFKSIVDSYGNRSQFTTPKNKADVSLLKLHGSLNWTYPTQQIDEISLRKDAFSWPAGPGAWSVPRHLTNQAVEVHDFLVVPPAISKDFTRVLREVWVRAATALEGCEELVLLGYSLPAADIQAKWLLWRSLRPKPRKREIVIVNPSCADRLKLTRFLDQFGKVSFFNSFQGFIESRGFN